MIRAMVPLLQVSDLRVEVDVPDVGWCEAVSGLNFTIHRGEALGVVGESGCGKSLSLLAVLGLLPTPGVRLRGGSIQFDGETVDVSDPRAFRALRGSRIGYVPQDAMTGLNPVWSVGEQIAEVVRLHEGAGRSLAKGRAIELLAQVGIPSPASRYGAYPHELSGGQRQRVLLAMALAGDPELLLLDEPTTALDVTVQAQILLQLARLRRDRALALLFVTHDLAVVSQTCDRVLILYAGSSVESGPAVEVLSEPRHPYTRALLASIPTAAPDATARRLRAIIGSVPGLGHWPSGCSFRDRCSRAEGECARVVPALSAPVPGREVSCHFADEVRDG